MRFRSSLSRASLYGREASPRGPGTSRRVTTLIIALVLVILLMQEAGNPEVYRRFFARLGTPLTGASAAGEPVPGAVQADPRAVRPAAPLSEAPQPDRDWAAALGSLPEEALRTLAAAVLRTSDARPRVGDEAIVSAGAERFAERNASLAAALRANLPEGASEASAAQDRLLASFAAAFLANIDDPTVLRGGEGRSLLYWLAEGAARPDTQPLTVGVLPLVDQSDVYRGREVRITGRAVRTETSDAPENSFGISTTSRVWLHPDDGSERPLVVLIEQMPEEVAAVDAEGIAVDGPHIEAVGTYVTRLAYRSGQGVDIAPLLVGEVRLLEPAPQPAEVEGGRGALPLLGWLVPLTAAAGVLVAAAVYWYTERAARARRALRQRATRPPSGALSALGDAPRHDSDSSPSS